MKRNKYEEWKESQITTINIFGFIFYIKKLYFARKYLVWKKSSLYHHILFTVFMRSNIFEMCSNNRRKLNIHKHTLYYIIIEKYINRLSATTQNFIAMEYLILMSEKHLHFRKKNNMWQGNFFPLRRSNWIHALRKYFSNYVYLEDMYKTLKKI